MDTTPDDGPGSATGLRLTRFDMNDYAYRVGFQIHLKRTGLVAD